MKLLCETNQATLFCTADGIIALGNPDYDVTINDVRDILFCNFMNALKHRPDSSVQNTNEALKAIDCELYNIRTCKITIIYIDENTKEMTVRSKINLEK